VQHAWRLPSRGAAEQQGQQDQRASARARARQLPLPARPRRGPAQRPAPPIEAPRPSPVLATFLKSRSRGLKKGLPSALPLVNAERYSGRPAACRGLGPCGDAWEGGASAGGPARQALRASPCTSPWRLHAPPLSPAAAPHLLPHEALGAHDLVPTALHPPPCPAPVPPSAHLLLHKALGAHKFVAEPRAAVAEGEARDHAVAVKRVAREPLVGDLGLRGGAGRQGSGRVTRRAAGAAGRCTAPPRPPARRRRLRHAGARGAGPSPPAPPAAPDLQPGAVAEVGAIELRWDLALDLGGGGRRRSARRLLKGERAPPACLARHRRRRRSPGAGPARAPQATVRPRPAC
jgi:hypothetical protein